MLNCFFSLCSYFTDSPPHTELYARYSTVCSASAHTSLTPHTQSYMFDAQLFLQPELIPHRQHTLLHARFSTAFSAMVYTSQRTGSLRAGSGTGKRIFSGPAAGRTGMAKRIPTTQRKSYAIWPLAASTVITANHYLIISYATEKDRNIYYKVGPRVPFRTAGTR